MRGDQLACQWRVIRAIEASPNGLTVAEIAKREETGIRTIYRDLEALQPECHAKAQRTPREIFRILLSFLNIFLTPSHSIRKTIKGFSAIPPWRSLRLGVSMYSAGKAAQENRVPAAGKACRLWEGIWSAKNGRGKVNEFNYVPLHT